jgi:hypothetical protein
MTHDRGDAVNVVKKAIGVDSESFASACDKNNTAASVSGCAISSASLYGLYSTIKTHVAWAVRSGSGHDKMATSYALDSTAASCATFPV